MKRSFAFVCIVLLVGSIIGCGESKPTNIAEGVDEKAVADYEKMLEEDAKRMSDAGAEEPE